MKLCVFGAEEIIKTCLSVQLSLASVENCRWTGPDGLPLRRSQLQRVRLYRDDCCHNFARCTKRDVWFNVPECWCTKVHHLFFFAFYTTWNTQYETNSAAPEMNTHSHKKPDTRAQKHHNGSPLIRSIRVRFLEFAATLTRCSFTLQ